MIQYIQKLHLDRLLSIQMMIQCAGIGWMSFFFARGDMYPAAVLQSINGLIFIGRFGSVHDLFESKIAKIFSIFACIEAISFINYLYDASLSPNIRAGLFYHSTMLEFFCYSLVWYINFIFFYVYIKRNGSVELLKVFMLIFFIAGIFANYRAHMLYHVKTGNLTQFNYFYLTLAPIPFIFYFIKSKIKYICLLIVLLCVVFGYKRSGIIACGLLLVANLFLDSNLRLKSILTNSVFVILLLWVSLAYMGNNKALERTQTRMERLESDGGSGRTDHIHNIFSEMQQAPLLHQIIGYGYMGYAARHGNRFIDVELVAIWYYYGLLGWITYALIHFCIIKNIIRLYKFRQLFGLDIVCSLVSFYVIFLFYGMAAEPFSYHFHFCLLFAYLGFIEAIIALHKECQVLKYT